MAIAPLLDTESADWSPDLYGASWPRPCLRPLPPPGAAPALAPVPSPGPLPALRLVPGPSRADVAARQARRAVVRRRRRAVLLGAVAVVAAGLTCGLALPLASLGGSPAAAHARAQVATAGEAVYVVRPGDTLWSIASRFDRGGDPRAMAEALARETGSAIVVPGERVPIP